MIGHLNWTALIEYTIKKTILNKTTMRKKVTLMSCRGTGLRFCICKVQE